MPDAFWTAPISTPFCSISAVSNSNGLEALHNIKRQRPDADVIVVSGFATVQSAVEAMKLGAYDYIAKPFGLQELRLLLESVAGHLQREDRKPPAAREPSNRATVSATSSGAALKWRSSIASLPKPVRALTLCSFSAKAAPARKWSPRPSTCSGPLRSKPFIPVDCGSLVPTLIESELFGHVRGAFTGATGPKDGLLAIADGGTVFLDEIGELPIDLQAKLLRAIQEREIRPVGGTKQVPINVRILGRDQSRP